jgi:hypothetical protein
MEEIYCGGEVFCFRGFGWGVGAKGGGEEKKLFGLGCPEYSVLRMVSVDVGDSVGYIGRTRFYQVISRRLESSDCSEGWEQSWVLLRGDNVT